MNNLSIVTYTHSNCKDIWNAYLSRLDKHATDIQSYMLSDITTQEFKNHIFIQYDDNKNYCQEFIRCLKEINSDFIIYMQEDFILYDNVQNHLLHDYVSVLKTEPTLSYIRLIKCGDVTNIQYNDNKTLYYVCEPGKQNNSINSFSMQPTIWRKEDFINLYSLVNAERFGESWTYTQAMNRLSMNGLYSYQGEAKRGENHFDSLVFPYIATAIVKGKWNVSEYPDELKSVSKEYKIDLNKRGYR